MCLHSVNFVLDDQTLVFWKESQEQLEDFYVVSSASSEVMRSPVDQIVKLSALAANLCG